MTFEVWRIVVMQYKSWVRKFSTFSCHIKYIIHVLFHLIWYIGVPCSTFHISPVIYIGVLFSICYITYHILEFHTSSFISYISVPPSISHITCNIFVSHPPPIISHITMLSVQCATPAVCTLSPHLQWSVLLCPPISLMLSCPVSHLLVAGI